MAMAGDTVPIYRDPFLKLHSEGNAKLIKKVKQDHFVEVWQVEFRPGAALETRTIARI